MIYQFTDGPLDGEEQDLPELPLESQFHYEIPKAMTLRAEPYDPDTDEGHAQAVYVVTDIGEMRFSRYA